MTSKSLSFVGREWVFAKIDKSIDARNQCVNNTNVTAIFGCAGSGKSCLIKQLQLLSAFKDSLLAVYECCESATVEQLITDLHKQMTNKLNLKDKLNRDNRFDGSREDIYELYRQYVLFPLIEHTNGEHQYIIAIDSIDTNGEICQIVSEHIHLMPKYVNLIVTARPKRRRGFTKMFSGARKIVIDDMRKVNVINDMKCYIMHRIKQINCHPLGTTGKKSLNQIGIKSNGCFLYVKLILDSFQREIMRIEEVNTIGATLNGLYLALCNKLFDLYPENEDDYKLIIDTTLASENCKTTKDVLQKCLHLEEHYLCEKLNELNIYSILQFNNDDTIQMSHTSLVEWITDVKYCTPRFLCEQSFGHILLALCCSQSAEDYYDHISKSDILNLNVYHYSLWLLLSINISDIEMLCSVSGDSLILQFIHKCLTSTYETMSHKYLINDLSRNCDDSQVVNTINSDICDPKFDTFKDDTNYSEFLSHFQRALFVCDVPTLQELMSTEADLVNQCYIKQKSALYWAIKSGNTSVVELFIEYEADVNAVCDNESGITPLMVAVCQNNYEICELLLDSDADVDACDALSRTPLVYAILEHVSPKIVELLLFWGAHTDYMDQTGRSLLCLAADESQCSVETIRLLLAVGCDELHKDNNGRTALHMAASHGNTFIVEALLDIGGDALQHSRDNEGKLALHDSAYGGYSDTSSLLISNESINSLSHDGKSPLRLATLNSHIDVMTLLVESGANINYVDADGRSTLYCVASGSGNEMSAVNSIKHLAKLGADLELKDLEGRTALHVSAWQGLAHIVKVLIELGADCNAVDNEGRTPLHMCVWNGFIDVITVLIESGCNVNHVSSTQRASPLLIAAQQGHIEACELLMNAGANASQVDLYGRNAHDVAINCGHRDIAILLESRDLSAADQCPTLSSHASTAETAAIGEIEALFDCPKAHISSRDSLQNKRDNSRKHKKMMSISKLTKLLH